jgi:hypothetical protein
LVVRSANRAAGCRLLSRFSARVAAAAVALIAAFAGGPAVADLVVPANAVVSLSSGQFDLACTDVVVAGTLRLDTGSVVNVRHVTVQAGGVIDGSAGTVRLGGNWTNGGQFIPGTSRVEFRDLCSLPSSTLAGNTTFANLSLVSSFGKNYAFTAGQTQTVGGLLEITGTLSQPIQIRSTTPGSTGSLNLLPGGTQQILHVGVTDNQATGQWLAPGQSNEGGGGNARRWFGTPSGGANAAAIPVNGAGTLAVLALLLALLGGRAARGRRKGVRSIRRDDA